MKLAVIENHLGSWSYKKRRFGLLINEMSIFKYQGCAGTYTIKMSHFWILRVPKFRSLDYTYAKLA